MKRNLVFLVPAVVVLAAWWYPFSGHTVPPGQPALAAMDLIALRADFNRAADRTRVIVLFSPT